MLKLGVLILLLLLAPTSPGQQFHSAQDYYQSAVAKATNGDSSGAVSDLTRAIELNPKFVEALIARGQLRFVLKDWDGALADYDKALELAPNTPGIEMVYNNRSVIRLVQGDREGALADLNKAILLNPKYAMAYSMRGVIRDFKGDFTGAAADYEKALELSPNLTATYINRGLLRFQLGNLTEALADFNKALELQPDLAKPLIERGCIRGILGEFDQAIADIKKGFALNPESVSDKKAPGQFTSPFENLDRFITANPNSARAYEMRGILRLAQGKKTEAAEDFSKSLALDPKLKPEIDKAMKVTF